MHIDVFANRRMRRCSWVTLAKDVFNVHWGDKYSEYL